MGGFSLLGKRRKKKKKNSQKQKRDGKVRVFREYRRGGVDFRRFLSFAVSFRMTRTRKHHKEVWEKGKP